MIKRVVLLVLAAALLLISVGLGLAAGWGYSALGPDGVMRFGLGTINPDPAAKATIIDVDRYSLTIPYIQSLGDVTLEATTGEAGDPSDVLFLGAAATPDVDEYLKGTPYSVAIRFDNEWQTRQVPGTATAAPPREQSFWLAAGVGREPAISVPDQRPLTLVVMHPAGLPTGAFELRFGFTVKDASTWILGLGIASAVLLIVAIVLIVMAFRVKTVAKHRGKHEAESAAAPQPLVVAAVAAPVAAAESTGAMPAIVWAETLESAEAAQPEPDTASEPDDPTEALEVTEAQPEPEPEPESERPEPAGEPAAEPAPEPTAEPTAQPTAQPAGEPEAEPEAVEQPRPEGEPTQQLELPVEPAAVAESEVPAETPDATDGDATNP